MKDVLYVKFDVRRFKDKTNDMTSSLSKDVMHQSIPAKLENYSLENFVTELQREISANHQAQIELIKSKFDYNINSFLQQLSFNMTSLFETSTNDSIKHKTQLLETHNEDYEFILRSITDENSNHNSKVLYMFRINPVDPNEARKLEDNLLYLQGVTANRVMNVLELNVIITRKKGGSKIYFL